MKNAPNDGIYNFNGKLYYYENGELSHAGVIKIDGDYYYAATGGVIVRNTSKEIYLAYTNGLVPAGTYEFDADGKMIIK